MDLVASGQSLEPPSYDGEHGRRVNVKMKGLKGGKGSVLLQS